MSKHKKNVIGPILDLSTSWCGSVPGRSEESWSQYMAECQNPFI